MSEAKFTKGPWVAFQNEVGSWEVNCRASEDDVVGRYSPTICSLWDVTYTNLNNKLQEPNAHLIAAAPEMYEMLSEVRNELFVLTDEVNDQRMSRVHSQTETQPDMHDMETLHLIDRLLAKARGEIQ